MPRILDTLDGAGVRATFFVLGWLAEREPAMIRTIAEAGHEVASHGWEHRRLRELDPETFRESVRRTRQTLEDILGESVVGYRAPSFSMVPGTEWALDVLVEEDHEYDSSMFPTSLHRQYGYPAGRRDVHQLVRPSGTLVEVPLATATLGGFQVPAAGGAYGRFFPRRLIRTALTQACRNGTSATLYTHPWEFDVEGARRLDLPLMARLRMTTGRRRTRGWTKDVLTRFEFRTIRETVRAFKVPDAADPATA